MSLKRAKKTRQGHRVKCSWNWLDPECLYIYTHFGFEINARDKMGNNHKTKIKEEEEEEEEEEEKKKKTNSVKGLLDGCQVE